MSLQQARKFVAENRPLCLMFVRCLAVSGNFNTAPYPFKGIGERCEGLYTTKMILMILWFMSWTDRYDDESVHDFMKHVNEIRVLDKATLVTKNDLVDDSVSIDLSQFAVKPSGMVLASQSGFEDESESVSSDDGEEEGDFPNTRRLIHFLSGDDSHIYCNILARGMFFPDDRLQCLDAIIAHFDSIPTINNPTLRRYVSIIKQELITCYIETLAREGLEMIDHAKDLSHVRCGPQSGYEFPFDIKEKSNPNNCVVILKIIDDVILALLFAFALLNIIIGLDYDFAFGMKREMKPQSGMEILPVDNIDQSPDERDTISYNGKGEIASEGERVQFSVINNTKIRQLTNGENIRGLNKQCIVASGGQKFFKST
jgi:hypothetical protein